MKKCGEAETLELTKADVIYQFNKYLFCNEREI